MHCADSIESFANWETTLRKNAYSKTQDIIKDNVFVNQNLTLISKIYTCDQACNQMIAKRKKYINLKLSLKAE